MWIDGFADDGHSIREFCDVGLPILMFDAQDNYSVMTLEEVGSPPVITLRAFNANTKQASSSLVRARCSQASRLCQGRLMVELF
jgi:hypothetical protein